MALFSLRNFTYPLMDTRSLVTIILIAAIFGVIRLAGGGAGERTVLPHGGVKRPVANKFNDVSQKGVPPIEFKGSFEKANPIDDLKVISKRAGQPVEQDDFLGEIINQPAPTKKAPANAGNRPGAKLDDIARSMGIK